MGFAKRHYDYTGDYGHLVFNGGHLPHFDCYGNYCAHEKGCPHELEDNMSQLEKDERAEFERLQRWQATIVNAYNSIQPIIQSWKDENAKLRAALKVADKALEHYGDTSNWMCSHCNDGDREYGFCRFDLYVPEAVLDGFLTAQQARTEIAGILE